VESHLPHPTDVERYVSIVKTYTFEAAHHLPGHIGACKNPHGHSYQLEVEVAGPIVQHPGATDDGMVFDFGDLDGIVDDVILRWVDHQDLTRVMPYRTTAENMVCDFAERLGRVFHETPLRLETLTLWETAKGRAIWRRPCQ